MIDYINYNKMYISKFGFKLVVLFIVFCLLGRFLFPYGDEPDIMVRGPELIEETGFWNLYKYFPEYVNNIDYSFYYEKQNFSDLWNNINNSFSKTLEINFLRFFINIIILSPMLWALVFRDRFIKVMSLLKFKLTNQEWNLRLDSLSLSLIYSGIIYYSGLFSIEQFTLVLSLYIFLFWGNYIFVSIIFIFIASVDLGNSMILLIFIFIALYFSFLGRKKKSLKLIYLSMAGMLGLALILGIASLSYIQYIPFLAKKSQGMLALEEYGGYRDKYPILLRPFITLMTSIFMTPTGIKVVLVYLMFLVGIFKFIIKLINVNQGERIFKENILLLSSVTTLLFFVFLFPNYANAKYYIFMVPFFISSILQYFSRNKIMLFFVTCNIVLFLHLFLYGL